MVVVYVGRHTCHPIMCEKKPNKEHIKNVLHVRPTITPGQLQIDTVREALLSDTSAEEVIDVAVQYSNKRHIQYLRQKVQQTTRPEGSDIEERGLCQKRVRWPIDP
jgi:hypothetical protein